MAIVLANQAIAQQLLLLGIVIILSAIIGGGLDAAGLIKLPTLRDWRTQAAAAGFGVITMACGLASLWQVADQSERVAWFTRMQALENGAVGLPSPPPWDHDRVRGELVDLLRIAGDDYDENCSIASFIVEYGNKLDHIPDGVRARLTEPLPLSNKSAVCYRESLSALQRIQTEESKRSQESKPANEATPVGALRYGSTQVASNDLSPVAEALLQRPAVQGRVALLTSATRVLEDLTAVGDQGYIYLGERGPSGLGTDRTVQETAPTVGRTATVRIPVNLRAIGSDNDYSNHRVNRVLAPGTRVLILTETPITSRYAWALVKVVATTR